MHYVPFYENHLAEKYVEQCRLFQLPNGSVVIELAEGREDSRSDEARTQEEASHYELKSGNPGIDSEALWVRKGKSYRYGYKKHVLTDEQGLVEAVISTVENCAYTIVLPDLIEKSELA